MVTYCMPDLTQMAPHAVLGLRKSQRLFLRLTVSSLRYSPLSST